MNWNKYFCLVFFLASSMLGAKDTAQKSNEIESLCLNFLKESKKSVRDLAKYLTKAERKALQPRYKQIWGLSEANCKNPKVAQKLQEIFQEYLSVHDLKIAIMVPENSISGKAFTKVLSRMAKDAQLRWTFQTYKTADLKEEKGYKSTKNKIAKAILIDGVDLIVGGIGRSQAKLIREVASKARVPSLLLHNNPDSITAEDLSFRIAPHPSSLVNALLAAAKDRGVAKVAILATESAFDNQFTTSFRALAKEAGIEIVKEIKYRGQETEQLDLAVRALLQINRDERAEEYAQLLESKMEEAEAAGIRFRESSVFLEPIVEFDAVFIPDDFRQSRYVAKMLKFYGVEKTAMLGGPRWRAAEMVKPFDPFLKHSLFADNVGYYSSASNYVRSLLKIEENYFLSPQKTLLFDMAMVAERLVRSLKNVGKPEITRAELFANWKDRKVAGKKPKPLWHWNAVAFGFEPGSIALKYDPENTEQTSDEPVSKAPVVPQAH
jgi:hypothetical protein